MLDLVIGLLKSLLNCRTKNWVKTTNPAKQGGQQQLEGEIIRAERFDPFLNHRKFPALCWR